MEMQCGRGPEAVHARRLVYSPLVLALTTPCRPSGPSYECYAHALEAQGVAVHTGQFGADMQVALINDGPVTILLEANAPP